VVEHVGTDSIDVATRLVPANGDGIAWMNRREVAGTRVNRVERLEATGELPRWRLWPATPLRTLAGLRAGVTINRNRDETWETALARPSAERRIGVRARLVEAGAGYLLTYVDDDGIAGSATILADLQNARDAAGAEAALRKQLGRLGDTDYELVGAEFSWREPRFIPLSAIGQARRVAIGALTAARLERHPRLFRRPAEDPPLPCPDATLSYLANVYNHAARAFYARHGVTAIDAAYEAHEAPGEVSLMITRHCLRHSFSLCPKQAKGVVGVQGQVRAEPMTLVNGDDRLTLRFDCKACEMHVVGRMRDHVLASAPPGATPACPSA
jgi:23S rRNA 5-hydroxycytidine C2501 synthase